MQAGCLLQTLAKGGGTVAVVVVVVVVCGGNGGVFAVRATFVVPRLLPERVPYPCLRLLRTLTRTSIKLAAARRQLGRRRRAARSLCGPTIGGDEIS
jgi:hypothetical protein